VLVAKGVDLSCIVVGCPDVKEWFEHLKISGKNLYVVWKGQKVGAYMGLGLAPGHWLQGISKSFHRSRGSRATRG